MRAQPISCLRSCTRPWRRPIALLARWLIGWNQPRRTGPSYHPCRYHPDCPACRAELSGKSWLVR